MTIKWTKLKLCANLIFLYFLSGKVNKSFDNEHIDGRWKCVTVQ